MGQRVSELVQVLLSGGSTIEGGRVTSIHVGREIYDCTVRIELKKVQ